MSENDVQLVSRLLAEAPLLRGFDARALAELSRAAQRRTLQAGESLYRDGEQGETLFLVERGALSVFRERKGDGEREALRDVAAGELLGEEVTVLPKRHSCASAKVETRLFELPVQIFQRAVVRSGKAELAERLERTLRRNAASDLLKLSALRDQLDQGAQGVLLDAVTFQTAQRGEAVYRGGDRSDALYLVADGLVQLQEERDGRARVIAYLTRGDLFGADELESGVVRQTTAIASGPSILLRIPSRVVRQLGAEQEDLFDGISRVSLGLREEQRKLLERAEKGATQHLFRDVYRLKIARSLLVIDLDSCVRCGHCAWSCGSLYGTSRLVRRGDKVLTREALREGFDVFRSPASELSAAEPAAPHALLLPNSCQHCENPACMIDCPTGAIAKDAGGEVFIRDELCTGCGACARSCPWDNIQMGPRPADAKRPPAGAELLAHKCDLCRPIGGDPACVQACPTEAIFRVDPSQELAELAGLFGQRSHTTETKGRAASPIWPLVVGAAIAALGIAFAGALMQLRDQVVPGRGLGYAAGWLSALGIVGLGLYAVPKRGLARLRKQVALRGWLSHPRLSAVSYAIHVGLGLVTAALLLLHAPLVLRGTTGSGLLAMTTLGVVSGGLLALGYAFVPALITRVEHKPLLPEDFAAEEDALQAQLFRALSGKDELLKAVFDRVIGPYVRSRLGPLSLVVGRRSLRAERARLKQLVVQRLDGRGQDRLAGLDDLIRTAVALRALPAQRLLQRVLRLPLPLHVISVVATALLLVAHIVGALQGAP